MNTPAIISTTAAKMPGEDQVDRAIRLTYVQLMVAAVFGASTGGMFLIGFAIRLGAGNVTLGLMTTIPTWMVVFQFAAAWMIERGISRKTLTLLFGFTAPLCWLLIAIIPRFQNVLGKSGPLSALLGILALAAVAQQFAGNARSSWVGELIPEKRRGKFFGYCGMFAAIVGAVFAILEGRFLDYVRYNGLSAYTELFFFGIIFGVAAASLNIPQPDCPLPGGEAPPTYREVLTQTLRSRDLVRLASMHAVQALAGIASPFVATYWIRDLKFAFFPLGLLNAVGTAAMLFSSPLWGKAVDRWGSRPVLMMGYLLWAPCPFIWLLLPPGVSLTRACLLLPPTGLLSGMGIAAISVAISSMLYKVTRPEGRSIQLAAYSTFVALVSAPMPALGGYLVTRLQKTWPGADLRITFYLSAVFVCAAALMARRIQEPGSAGLRAGIKRRVPRAFDAITRRHRIRTGLPCVERKEPESNPEGTE